jgi:ribosome maturation factor RimP
LGTVRHRSALGCIDNPEHRAGDDKSTGEEAAVAKTGGPSTPTKHSLVQIAAAVSAALEPTARAAGFDLEGVEIVPAGSRRVVRVVVDRDGGLDLDAVAVASRDFAVALDAAPALGESPYVLEVTSPGVDRPLTEPRHWRRATGRLVEASMREGGTVRGRVIAADDATVSFDVDGTQRVVPLADLGTGRMQLEFDRPKGEAHER